MALTDASVMQQIINDLAAAYLNIVSTVDLARNPNNMLYWLTDARKRVVTATSGAASDYDYILTLQTSMRSLEKNLTTNVTPLLSNAASSLNTYFNSNNKVKFRDYWNAKTAGTTLTFSDNFREFWGVATGEEVIVKLGHASYPWTGGSKYTVDNTNPILLTAMEFRANTTIGSSDINIAATMITSNGGTELVSTTIPANTPIGTSISLSGTSRKYQGIYQSSPGVYSISISGGTSGDSISLWIQ